MPYLNPKKNYLTNFRSKFECTQSEFVLAMLSHHPQKAPSCGRNFVLSRWLSTSHSTFFFLDRGRLLWGITERAKRKHYLIPACRVTERPRPIGSGAQMITALFILLLRKLVIKNILTLFYLIVSFMTEFKLLPCKLKVNNYYRLVV